MAPTATRSTLEEMLESIKRREEKPPDVPPALPKRPTSKARLPSAIRMRKAIVGTVGAIATLRTEASATRGEVLNVGESNLSDASQSQTNASIGLFSVTSVQSAEVRSSNVGDAVGANPSDIFHQLSLGTSESEELRLTGDLSLAGEGKARDTETSEFDVAVKQNGEFTDMAHAADQIEERAETIVDIDKIEEIVETDRETKAAPPTAEELVRSPDKLEVDKIDHAHTGEAFSDEIDKDSFVASTGEASTDNTDKYSTKFLVVAAVLQHHDSTASYEGIVDLDQADKNIREVLDIGPMGIENGQVGKTDWAKDTKEVAECQDDGSGSDYEHMSEPASVDDKSLEKEDSQFSFHPPSAQPEDIIINRVRSKKWKDDGVSGLKKNSRVWCLNLDNKWTLGVIHATTDAESIVSTADSQPQSRAPVGVRPQLLRIPSTKVLPANPDILEGVDDLIQLSYLNEPAVLHNLQHRYTEDKIYTRAGPVLIAVNPFKKVPLYTNDFVQTYKRKSKDGLAPHVYLTAESAFGAMMKDEVNQSIIISGESGAGKTETAKIAMQYLAALGGGGGVENEILQTNPILEAFGNAKTLRNDNSSRFGKLIDIYFEDSGKICGAKIQTYLLEKSRVVQQANGERAYHVFYQLCAGADLTLRERLNLRSAEDYHYLNQSTCMVIENVDDAAQFHLMLAAMNVVQISKVDQESAFAMLAAVLWLGNITFSVFDNENHVYADDNEAVECASKLLKCNKEHLMRALTTRKIHAGHESIVQKLTYAQAVDSRDALAKAIYASLFDWLVDRINKSLEVGKRRTGRSISILDIYGFESFQKNSFEQLCINYANERLQQFFNRHLFKLEQEEYSSEGIDWTRVEFEDNQECLELIEKRPLGLISLLDEECTFPKGTDFTLADKLKEHLAVNPRFRGERIRAFRIFHYAGEVTYDTTGFLEKNRDLLHSDLLQLLGSCEAYLPQLFAANIGQGLQKLISPLRRNGTESQKQSVAAKFKGQLFKLMQRLESTTPHFIRCIKPNTLQLPGVYKQDLVLHQLRCCGVLEVVRISRSGYPTRVLHQNFANRYGFLLPLSFAAQQDPLSICVAILQQFNIPPDMYQVGVTKLFFRAGQIGRLEDTRAQTLRCIIHVQKIYRGYKVRMQFKNLKRAAILLQSLLRGAKARKEYKQLKQRHEAAIVIQKFVRCRAAKKNYNRTRSMVILIQSVARGWLARKEFAALQRQLLEKKVEAEPFEQEAVLEMDAASTLEPDAGIKLVDSTGSIAEMDEFEFPELKVSKVEIEPDATTKIQPLSLAELQSRVLSAEAALQEKEEENALLRQRLNQYETRWSEYEAKMTSMEEMWQKQMTSLQLSLAAAKKSLAAEEPASHTGKQDSTYNLRSGVSRQRATRHILPHDDDDFDWDDNTSVGTKTPDQSLTPRKPLSHSFDVPLTRGELDFGRSVVGHLAKEFEHRTQVFNDDADFLVEVKSGQTEANLNPDDELRKLKQRFDTWKKDFKVRLRETKGILQKLGSNDSAEKTKKKWWGKKAY